MSQPPIRTHLKRLRESRGVTAVELARQAGIARPTLYAIENGSYVPNTAVALQLARALGVTVEDLFHLDSAPLVSAIAHETEQAGADFSPGEPVQLCRVGDRLVAAAARCSHQLRPVQGLITARGSSGAWSVETLSTEVELNRNLLIAGCDPAISLLADRLASSPVHLAAVECSSLQALDRLKAGRVHVAGCHLRDDPTGEYNLPFVRRLFPEGGFVIVSYASWEQGFVVARGNPHGVRSASSLLQPGVSFINREPGSGSRALLDRLLSAEGIPSRSVRGYRRITNGHLSVAQTVASGRAQAGIATSLAARAFGLDFIPLAVERYDLVTLESFARTPPVSDLFDLLTRSDVRRQIEWLAGYDAACAGEVRA